MKNNNTFTNKTILITGGTGSIGRKVVIQFLSKQKPKLVKIFARNEYRHFELEERLEVNFYRNKFEYIIGDIRDPLRLDEALKNVDIVIHAASLKHINYCEKNPEEAIKTIVLGSQNLIDLSIKNNVSKVIAISTDKAVYPISVMGISKLMAERLFIKNRSNSKVRTKFTVVRLGNVLNSSGSVVPKWIREIKKGKNIEVTDQRMRRFFMSMAEAVELIFYTATVMQGREIIVFKMPEVNIFDLAKKTIKKYGDSHIKIKITGIKDGEKIKEQLYTNEESGLMYENEKYYIIQPDQKTFLKRKHCYYF